MRPDTRLSTQLLGPPINEQSFPYGTTAIHPDDTEQPVSRWWLVVPLLVLALAALVAVFGTGPGKVRALPNMAKDGYR